MTLSLLTIKDVGYEKKDEEIKDAYPKKVCHMLKRHVRKKDKKRKERRIPKEGMPHAHKACQNEKKRKIVHIHGK